jgi:hypothetical protein
MCGDDDVLSVPSVETHDDARSDDCDIWLCGDEDTLDCDEMWTRFFHNNGIDYTAHATPATAPLGLDVLLFDVMAEPLVQWCGPCNRFGPSCATVAFAAEPTGLRLAKYRELAKTMQIPVLLLWGPPPPFSARYATLLSAEDGSPCDCRFGPHRRGGTLELQPGRRILRPLDEAVWF